MVDAVENLEEKEEKVGFTVIAIDQVIWAKIYKDRIVLRVTGEEKALTVTSDDGLYPFYLDQFTTHRDTQIDRIEQGRLLKEENKKREGLAVVPEEKTE